MVYLIRKRHLCPPCHTGETSVTQRWVRGEVSNFQYLMALNTLAGRSYNDLMQYPVFPWILADYTSEEIDLANPKTFRDLSRPMGAQTEQRLEQFRKRFEEWDNPHNETPPYHYGTHYSRDTTQENNFTISRKMSTFRIILIAQKIWHFCHHLPLLHVPVRKSCNLS